MKYEETAKHFQMGKLLGNDMYACIEKCTPASLALICQVWGLLLAPFPFPVLRGQSELKSLILVFYPENMKTEEEKARAMVLISVFSSTAAQDNLARSSKPTPQSHRHLVLGNRPVSGGPISQLSIFL